MRNNSSHYDVLIIGSGAAGLGLALSLADEKRIAIVSKNELTDGSSQHAQGGIAAVMDTTPDNLNAHIQDTLNAGAGLCDFAVVEYVVKNAKSAVEWLVAHGVQFTLDSQQFHLTQEGGHSRRRILHAADRTGAAIVKTLAEQVKEHTNIDCFTECIAVDLLLQQQQCVGALIFDEKNQREFVISARDTVLATGGASYVYLHTSNPNRTTGDGIAMAWRAGASVANLEFNQFHPTCLYHPKAERALITEVVRGEGGLLSLPNGERFMLRYDPRAEMAPRDIVSRAIHAELKKNQLDCVYLDISHREADFIKNTFPTIYSRCLTFGIDITKDRIPVVPAAHYTCGGVLTNLEGKTDVPHLYAIGETSCIGLHGANRMASNSLLECLVSAASSARAIKADTENPPPLSAESFVHRKEKNNNLPIDSLTQRIRRLMWNEVGIVRSDEGLFRAKNELAEIAEHIHRAFPTDRLSKSLIELRNMVTVSQLMVDSALMRKESRGLHYNTDHPTLNPVAENTVLSAD